jgi:TolB-like protein/DNA-binding winged helix-turn-helix (wHTH) protein/Tfp pilus assembly protein PilF
MRSEFCVGGWLIEPDLNRLTSGTRTAHIEPRVMDVLSFLALHPGEVCSKEQILQNVWVGTHVSDEVLTYAISEIRKALGDSAKNPSYIATISKRGYRLIAEVSRPAETLAPEPKLSVETVPSGHVTGDLPSVGEVCETPGDEEHLPAPVAHLEASSPRLSIAGPYRMRIRSGWVIAAGLCCLTVITLFGWLARPGVHREATITQSVAAAGKQSIAVLPFENLSPDPQNGYFADGVTEDIINQLSKISRLTVTSRAAVARFKKDPVLSEIGSGLGVSMVLKGTIRREGNQVRISAELIDVKTGRRLWGETYDRELTRIFEIQSNVAELIASTLNIELSAAERGHIERVPTANLTAYDCYLKGREYYQRYRSHDNDIAIGLFERALQLDPGFALAEAGLADCYAQRVYQYGFPEKWGDEALAASEKAVSMDPNLAETYKALGLTYAIRGWHRKALAAYYRAVELNPGYSPAVANVGAILEAQGNLVEALQWNLRALSLNPSAPLSNYNVGEIFRDLYDFEKSEEWFNKALVLDPDYEPAHHSKVLQHIARKEFSKARDESRKMLAANPASLRGLNAAGAVELYEGNYEKAKARYQESLAVASNLEAGIHLNLILWKQGQKNASRKFFEELIRSSQDAIEQGAESWHPRWNISVAHAIRGNREEALAWLGRAAAAGWRPAPESWDAPEFETLRGDARFERLMQTLKAAIDEQRKRADATQLLTLSQERSPETSRISFRERLERPGSSQ